MKKSKLLPLLTLLLIAIPLTVWAVTTKRLEIRKRASEPTSVPGEAGDFIADSILGQPDFTETVPNQVVGNRVFHPQGITVDRKTTPNRVYVWDSGNGRILGFSSLGLCEGGAKTGNNCTNNLDCPGSHCKITEDKKADLIFGQPDEFHASCNGDNTQLMPASASTLCSQPYPQAVSLMESPGPNTLAIDSYFNLYVFDKWNHRVLRYNDPFSADKNSGKGDTVADEIWGQEDFVHRGRNRGPDAIDDSGAIPGKNILNGGYTGSGDYAGVGVAIDSEGNLWVADVGNHRVLRFPNLNPGNNPQISKEANLIIGHLHYPQTVRVSPHTGQIYVIDWPKPDGHFRVLIYNPPFKNDMEANEIINGDRFDGYEFNWRRPSGLEIDPKIPDAFWLADGGQDRLLYYQKINGKWKITKLLGQADINRDHCDRNCCGGVRGCDIRNDKHEMCLICGAGGGIGLDSAGNIYVSDLQQQEIKRFSSSGTINAEVVILKSQQPSGHHTGNLISQYGMRDPNPMIYADFKTTRQLLVNDRYRVLFWNNPDQASSINSAGIPANGVLFQENFNSQVGATAISAFDKDSLDRVWMADKDNILVFNGPLTNGQKPNYVIHQPFNLKSGGRISIGNWLPGIAYDENNDALWIVDNLNHRIIRLLHPLEESREVDMILGQPSLDSNGRNRGLDPQLEERCSYMVPNGFSDISSMKLDNSGNLFIVDAGREGRQCSNNRILEYDKEDITPNPNNVFENSQGEIPMPQRVYGMSDFEGYSNRSKHRDENNPNVPLSITFNDKKMYVTADAYWNTYLKRVFVYDQPLLNCNEPCWVKSTSTLTIPGAQLQDPHFDSYGNFAILDHTWNRVLFFLNPLSKPSPSPKPSTTPTPEPKKASFAFKLKFPGVTGGGKETQVGANFVKDGKERVETVRVVSDVNGVFTGEMINIDPGTYDIYLKGWAHLQKKFGGVTLNSGKNMIDWTAFPLLAGDANGDNLINIQDFGVLVRDYLKTESPADFNLDSMVNIQDFRFIVENYLKDGDK